MDIFVPAFCIFLVLAQGVLSYCEGTFINNKIVNDKGDRFLSFSKHGAMYADLFVLTPVMFYMCEYGHQWSWGSVFAWTLAAFVASWVMNFLVYPKMATPSCHYDMEMKMTPPGFLHFVFMWVVLTVLFLFYLSTTSPSRPMAQMMTVIICLSLPFQTVVPDYVVKGKVDKLGTLQLIPLWGIMIAAYFNVMGSKWIEF